jgi:hypothetical protein
MKVIAVLSLALMLGLTAACTVEKTEEGRAPEIDVSGDAGKLPDYDVVKREEGRAPDIDVETTAGRMPRYDVDMADVSVDQTTRTVTVPDVDVRTEQREITVPDVNVEMPNRNQ